MAPPQAPNCPHCNGQPSKNEGLCKKHFDRLQKQWYSIAAATGFKDAEKVTESGVELKEFVSHLSGHDSAAHRHSTAREAAQEYYRQVGCFLYDYSFANEMELDIWKLHAEGTSVREITKVIMAKHPKSYKKTQVHFTIQRLSKIMRRLYSNG